VNIRVAEHHQGEKPEAKGPAGKRHILSAAPLTLNHHSGFPAILEALTEPGCHAAVLDLSAFPPLDDTGRWLLSRAAAEAERRGVALDIIGGCEFPQESGWPLVVVEAGLSADMERRWEALRCQAVAPSHPMPDDRSALVFGVASTDAIRKAFTRPFGGLIEPGPDGGFADVSSRCLAAIRHGGFAVSLTTKSAWALDLTVLMVEGLRSRHPGRDEDIVQQAEFCIAEAVSNALIHGNLGVESGMRTTMDGLRCFRDQIAERLTDPALARRRIEVTIVPAPCGPHVEITVSDHGAGFDLRRYRSARVDGPGKSGRGIPLIHRMSKLVAGCDGGTTLIIIT
jgi:Histidine kinase-like ATPase domain